MYQIKCDDYVLHDLRDDELVVSDPKASLEVNKVGEASFTIHQNHPFYGNLQKLKSVFEISDEYGVIFRGRMISDTADFYNSKDVVLEGAGGYLNDSIVRPYSFPEDFTGNAEYQTAAASGNVVAFFLGWLISQHNAQVTEAQRFKLGAVTVSDPNNYITRADSGYPNTWKTIEEKLFKSSLGGNLCFRHENDGTYIDYVSAFELTNTQEIVYGENLLDLKTEADATETYSACIPIGATTDNDDGTKTTLTIAGLPDGNVTSDIVKSGDVLYSRSAVEAYGYILAPVDATTWEDVTIATNLQSKGAAFLSGGGTSLGEAVELLAADLHFTDAEIRSFRVCRNVIAHSIPHGLAGIYPLSKLELDLFNPQNTKISVGSTRRTLTDINSQKESSTVTRIESAVNDLKGQIEKTETTVIERIEGIEGVDGVYFYIKYSAYSDGHVMTDIPTSSTMYMGTCSTNSETAPTDYTAYTWVKVRGEDGTDGTNGTDGKDGIDGAPGKDGTDGKDGTNGTKTIAADTTVRNFTVEQWANYGAPGHSESWVNIANASAYSAGDIIAIPGTVTDRGGISCILYGTVESVTGTSVRATTINCIYGSQGNPGTNGTNGTNGKDGKTQYLHIKYSDDGQTFTDDNGETLGAWIGTLVDFNEADSTNFADYTWKKFTEDVDEELEDLREAIETRSTTVLNDAESIIMTALKDYVETSNYEKFQETIQAELEVMADRVLMNFQETTSQITNVNGDLQAKFNQLYKYIKFSGDTAITIGSGDSAVVLEVDNETGIVFKRNGVEFGSWDGDYFKTGNIIISLTERARFGNFEWITEQDDGSLSIVEVS